MDSEDGWVSLSKLGRRLADLASDFDPRTYGFRKLSDLVRKIDAFEVKEVEGVGWRVRLKTAPRSRTRK